MTDNKAALDEKFDQWFYTARDPVKDLPYGSHLIYRVCDNDKDRFEIGCELLKAAFVGGHESALTTTPAPAVTDDELNKALQIADSRNEEVKELDFGNVFWACCILANYIRAATHPQPTDAP